MLKLKKKETIISNKKWNKKSKNILKKEIDKKVEELNNLVKDFQIERNKLKNLLLMIKKYGLKY